MNKLNWINEWVKRMGVPFIGWLFLLNSMAFAADWIEKMNDIKESTKNSLIEIGHTNDGWKKVDLWESWWFFLNSDFSINKEESPILWGKYSTWIEYKVFLNDGNDRLEAKKRIDELSMNIFKEWAEWFKAGIWYQIYGSWWWKTIQNEIHWSVWDTQIEQAKYSDGFSTPTLVASYEKEISLWDSNYTTTFKLDWTLPILFNQWICKFKWEGMLWKEILDWINVYVWADIWAINYPNQDAFIWYPLEDLSWGFADLILRLKAEFWDVFVWFEISTPMAWKEKEITANKWIIKVWFKF